MQGPYIQLNRTDNSERIVICKGDDSFIKECTAARGSSRERREVLNENK